MKPISYKPMYSIFIPPKTRHELAHPASEGFRHNQLLRLAISLISAGVAPLAVFAQLRETQPLLPEKEIRDIIHWAQKNLKPHNTYFKKSPLSFSRPKTHEITAFEHIRNFLKDSPLLNATVEELELELWEASPWRPLEDWRVDPIMLLAGCYYENEKINIVTDFSTRLDNGIEKAAPRGYGETLNRNEWMRRFRDHGISQTEAGAWIRINPLDGNGIGNQNVTAHRFTLLEIDDASVSLQLQLGLFAKLRLPIAAILTSGGRSIHAWIRIDTKDAKNYQEIAVKIHSLLRKFGVDPANKNPSRLSRLVGVQRIIGAAGDGRQRLLYFNPDATEWRAIL